MLSITAQLFFKPLCFPLDNDNMSEEVEAQALPAPAVAPVKGMKKNGARSFTDYPDITSAN